MKKTFVATLERLQVVSWRKILTLLPFLVGWFQVGNLVLNCIYFAKSINKALMK